MQVTTTRNKPKAFAWSYSRLKNFESCPKRHYHVDVVKDVREEESEQLKWGNALHDAFAKRQAHVTAPETVADVFNAYGVHLEKASIDREAGAKVIRRLVAEDRLRFVDTVGTRRLVQELAALVPDPKRPNVPLKRDANESGEHGDDGADSLRYALASYPYAVRQPETEPVIPAGKDRADWRTMVTMTDTDVREMPGGMLI